MGGLIGKGRFGNGERKSGKGPALLLAFCLLFPSCGYRFAGPGELPSGLRTLRVAMLENRTAETGAETVFTNDLIEEFARNGYLSGNGGAADGILSGRIKSMRTQTASRRGSHSALEREIRIAVDLRLTDAAGNTVWSAEGLSAKETYAVMPDKLETEHHRREAIAEISERLAEMAADRLTDNF